VIEVRNFSNSGIRARNICTLPNHHSMSKQSVEVKVDQDLCISCTACVNEAPDFFQMDPDTNKSKFQKENPVQLDANELDNVERAASICPTNAISVEKK